MWVLERHDPTLPGQRVKGRVRVLDWSDDELSSRDSILAALREGDCFDFAYEADVGDVFEVRYDAGRPPWRYRVEPVADQVDTVEWAIDTSDKLTFWRTQMVQVSAGPVDWAAS